MKVYLVLHDFLYDCQVEAFTSRKLANKHVRDMVMMEVIDLHKDPYWDCLDIKCKCAEMAKKHFKVVQRELK